MSQKPEPQPRRVFLHLVTLINEGLSRKNLGKKSLIKNDDICTKPVIPPWRLLRTEHEAGTVRPSVKVTTRPCSLAPTVSQSLAHRASIIVRMALQGSGALTLIFARFIYDGLNEARITHWKHSKVKNSEKLVNKLRALRVPTQQIRNRLAVLNSWGLRFLALIALATAAFEVAMSRLPLFIPNTAISPTVTVYILVEIGLLAVIATQGYSRFNVMTAGITFIGLLVSLLTLVFTNIQTGFKVSSTDVMTLDFQIATGVLLLAIEFCAGGILLPKLHSVDSKNSMSRDYRKQYIR